MRRGLPAWYASKSCGSPAAVTCSFPFVCREDVSSANLPQASTSQPPATAGSSREPEEEVNTAIRDALSVVKYRTLGEGRTGSALDRALLLLRTCSD